MMEKGRLVTDLKQYKFVWLLCNWCGEEQKHFWAEKHWLCDQDEMCKRKKRAARASCIYDKNILTTVGV